MNEAPSREFSFRTVTALMVAAFAVIALVLVVGVGRDLLRPVYGMAPQVSWLMNETTVARVGALNDAGRPETAALYALLAALSWSLIVAMSAGSFVWGVMNKGETVLGLDKSLGYLTALAGLYAVGTCLEVVLHLLKGYAITPRGVLHAIPALWFAAMIPSAAILARVGALVAHDAGVLVTAAVEGEPARLAALAASAEERRGAKSLEARLAKRLSAWRPVE